jgi:hypothetical protein
MPFTDRFIKVPIRSYDSKNAKLMGKEEYFPNHEMILPDEICSYFPSRDTDEDKEVTQVYMKSGHSFLIYLSIEKFEKLLNEHAEK